MMMMMRKGEITTTLCFSFFVHSSLVKKVDYVFDFLHPFLWLVLSSLIAVAYFTASYSLSLSALFVISPHLSPFSVQYMLTRHTPLSER